jgi:hypothetical protein
LQAVGILCGLIGGGLCWLLVAAVIDFIYLGVFELVFPGPHGARGMLAFYICLYGVWLVAVRRFAGKLEMVFWALVMFPMPTLLFAVWFLVHGKS